MYQEKQRNSMKGKTVVISCIVLALVINVFQMPDAKARGIGVGPNYIRLDPALRGSSYKQTIYVYNQNDYGCDILLDSTGEVGDWVSFYESNDLDHQIDSTTVPSASSKDIVIKISIPTDASYGEHEGNAIITCKSADPSTVDLNLPISLSINVTGEQNLNVSVWYVEVDNVEINEPCRLRLQFKNTGNVVADPHTEVIITKDGKYIDSLSGTAEPIQPDQLGTQELVWNTAGMVAGDYVAHFNITLDGKLVEEKDVSFKLLPPDTFTRNGTLLDITHEGKPEKGKVLKIIATFKNTGDVDTDAKFIGEIYKDGELIDVIESDGINVPKYKTENLYAYYTIQENGTYVISGYILYGGKKTSTEELSFMVGATKPSLSVIVTTDKSSYNIGEPVKITRYSSK